MLKPQDLAFFLALGLLLVKRDARLFVYSGIICLALAIPLFAFQIFFTAQRLTWYAAGFFLVAVIINLIKLRNENRN